MADRDLDELDRMLGITEEDIANEDNQTEQTPVKDDKAIRDNYASEKKKLLEEIGNEFKEKLTAKRQPAKSQPQRNKNDEALEMAMKKINELEQKISQYDMTFKSVQDQTQANTSDRLISELNQKIEDVLDDKLINNDLFNDIIPDRDKARQEMRNFINEQVTKRGAFMMPDEAFAILYSKKFIEAAKNHRQKEKDRRDMLESAFNDGRGDFPEDIQAIVSDPAKERAALKAVARRIASD